MFERILRNDLIQLSVLYNNRHFNFHERNHNIPQLPIFYKTFSRTLQVIVGPAAGLYDGRNFIVHNIKRIIGDAKDENNFYNYNENETFKTCA